MSVSQEVSKTTAPFDPDESHMESDMNLDRDEGLLDKENGLRKEAITVNAVEENGRKASDHDQITMNPESASIAIWVTTDKVALSDSGDEAKLCEHTFNRPHKCDSHKLVVRSGMNTVLVVASVVVLILVTIGCVLPSFSLRIEGIIAVAIEFGQDFRPAVVDYSLFTVSKTLIDEARLLDVGRYYVGLGTLCALCIMTVFVVPILESAVLLWQWFHKSSFRTRANWSVVIEVLQAWQYSEVYLLSIFVASW